jgi:hypothetical protein
MPFYEYQPITIMGKINTKVQTGTCTSGSPAPLQVETNLKYDHLLRTLPLFPIWILYGVEVENSCNGDKQVAFKSGEILQQNVTGLGNKFQRLNIRTTVTENNKNDCAICEISY